MSGSSQQKWGLFPPLSTQFPSDAERSLNDRMIEELKGQNNFEAPEETKRR